MPIRIADLALDSGLPHADFIGDSPYGGPLTEGQRVRFADPNALVADVEVDALVRRVRGGGPPDCRLVTKWSVGGFKAFNDQQALPLRPINLVFGPNSSGKSSLLHSFLWARHAHATKELDVELPIRAEKSVDLGGFENTCYKHSRDGAMTFSFDLHRHMQDNDIIGDIAYADIKYANDNWAAPITVKVTIQSVKQHKTSGAEPPMIEFVPRITRVCLESEGKMLLQAIRRADSDDLKIRRFNLKHPVFAKLLSDLDPGILGKNGLLLTHELLNRCLRGGSLAMRGIVPELALDSGDVDNHLNDLLKRRRGLPKRKLAAWRQAIEETLPKYIEKYSRSAFNAIGFYLESITYLGPMRHYPERYIFLSKQTKIEDDGSGSSAYQKLIREGYLREEVNDWLGGEQRFQTPYRFEVGRFVDASNSKNELEPFLRLVDRRTNTVVSPRDIGVGVSQMVPVLVAVFTSSNQTILVEQPELHLHPALQAEMGDLFIKGALGGPGNQFILETHSEHLILRLLRRIRQSSENDPNYPAELPKIRPEDVSVVYAQPTKDGTKLIPLRISPDGDFVDRWPDGFFTERGKELFT